MDEAISRTVATDKFLKSMKGTERRLYGDTVQKRLPRRQSPGARVVYDDDSYFHDSNAGDSENSAQRTQREERESGVVYVAGVHLRGDPKSNFDAGEYMAQFPALPIPSVAHVPYRRPRPKARAPLASGLSLEELVMRQKAAKSVSKKSRPMIALPEAKTDFNERVKAAQWPDLADDDMSECGGSLVLGSAVFLKSEDSSSCGNSRDGTHNPTIRGRIGGYPELLPSSSSYEKVLYSPEVIAAHAVSAASRLREMNEMTRRLAEEARRLD